MRITKEQIKEVYNEFSRRERIYLKTEEIKFIINKKASSGDFFTDIVSEFKHMFKNKKEYSNPTRSDLFKGRPKRNRKMIAMKSIHGRVIKTFESLTLAAEYCGNLKNKGNISNCCSGKSKSFNGYVWEYIN